MRAGRRLAVGLTILAALVLLSAPAARASDPPSLPDGLNVAIGAPVHANAGAAPSTSLAAVDDGDGTTRWCPSRLGVHTVTVDLGRVREITGTGVTFSGEEGSDGSTYTVSTGVRAAASTPLPGQPAAGTSIVQGPLYLDPGTRVQARYVTLSFRVPREENICLQELRVFSTSAVSRPDLELAAAPAAATALQGTRAVAGQMTGTLDALRDGGTNELRLPVFVDTADCATACAGLSDDLALARQAAGLGMRVVLDLRYADDASGATPAAWQGLSRAALARQVRRGTATALAAFAAHRIPVARVVLGGPLQAGILAPAGAVPPDRGASGWAGLTALLRGARAAVRQAMPRVPIELDADTGADQAATDALFDHLRAAGLRPSVIGLGYVPWRQGSLSALRSNLVSTVHRYRTPVVLVDVAFPAADIAGYGIDEPTTPYPDTMPGYLLTPDGQASYERDLVSLVAALPGGLGRGVSLQAPETEGSLGLFDSQGIAQPALDAFRIGSDATRYQTGDPFVSGDGTAPAMPAGPPAAPADAALPALPVGLNVAIGDPTSQNAPSASGSAPASIDDGDATTAWCPATIGVHRVMVDLGSARAISGTGITFSGVAAGGADDTSTSYSVSTGTAMPMTSQLGGGAVAPGANLLWAAGPADPIGTITARYVTVTWHTTALRTVCLSELRVYSPQDPAAAGLQRGADLSTLPSDAGTTFTLNGTPTPILDIFRQGGLNIVRLRLWVDPENGNFGTPSADPGCTNATCPDLTNDLASARAIAATGAQILLDVHYSDTWADPGHQNIPKAWLGETLPQLDASVRAYTQSAVAAFVRQGTPLSEIAVGNEITQGMLWQDTTLVAAAGTVTPAGTRTITVADASGISTGDTLYFDTDATGNSIAGVAGPQTEIVHVASIGASTAAGTPITLTAPLAQNHTGPVTIQDVQDSGHLLFDPATETADWGPLTSLVKAGIAGARAGQPAGDPLQVQLHIDRGGDPTAAAGWVAHMLAAGVRFDVLGLSYYPWYHGPLTALRANLSQLVDRFHLTVLIAEDQFPQAIQQGFGIDVPAYSNYPDTLPGYPIDPQGQAVYQRDLLSLIAAVSDGFGRGVYYWDADALGYLGQFDINGAAQPVIDANQLN